MRPKFFGHPFCGLAQYVGMQRGRLQSPSRKQRKRRDTGYILWTSSHSDPPGSRSRRCSRTDTLRLLGTLPRPSGGGSPRGTAAYSCSAAPLIGGSTANHSLQEPVGPGVQQESSLFCWAEIESMPLAVSRLNLICHFFREKGESIAGLQLSSGASLSSSVCAYVLNFN